MTRRFRMWIGRRFLGYRYFHAVRHHLVADWEAKGWRVINDMAWCHHGRHAVLMELEA